MQECKHRSFTRILRFYFVGAPLLAITPDLMFSQKRNHSDRALLVFCEWLSEGFHR